MPISGTSHQKNGIHPNNSNGMSGRNISRRIHVGPVSYTHLDVYKRQRLDIPLLNDHILKMIRMEPVQLPAYDFVHAQRLQGEVLERHAGELVILEGIHALNPDVITVPDTHTCRIYVSVRTRLQTGELLLHPEKIRLLRRMLRDRKNRGRNIQETLEMYDNVQAGENKYIMPYKHRRTFDVDTFVAYEAGVYKKLLLEDLEKEKSDRRLADLVETLEHLEPVDAVHAVSYTHLDVYKRQAVWLLMGGKDVV